MKKKSFLIVTLFLFAMSKMFAQPTFPLSDFTVVANTTSVISANSLCGAGKSASILDGWYITVSTASNCGFNISASSSSNGHINFFSGLGGGLTNLTYGSNNGSEFALREIHISVSGAAAVSLPMLYQGYKNGLPVSGATLIANNPSSSFPSTVAVTFTNIAAFQDVDDIMVIPQSAMIGANYQLWDVTIGTAVPACATPTITLSGQTNVLCNGGSAGSATMSASGGAPFTYTWFPSGGNLASATGLSAGTYTCITTNSCGATDQETVSITQPALALATSTAVTNALCNGANGSATITASGGTSPYTYTWSSGPTSSVEPTLLAGAYTVTVFDNNGCNLTKSVIVTQPSAIVGSTAVTNALCNGANGSATVTASGGTGAYSYTWSSGPTTSVEPTLLAGTYTVRVTDANNCSLTKSVTITQPSALVTTTAMTQPLCNGQNGSATVTASGGTGAYTYTWSSGPTTSVEPTLLAGTYTVRVTDANNCTSTKSVIVTQPSAIGTSTGYTNVFCFGGVGSASILASGGTPPFTYTWSTGATGTFVTGISAAVTYTARAIDANNCSSATRSIIISQPPALVTTTAVTNILCFGNATGAATVIASGGTGAYSYAWSSGSTSSVISGQTVGVKTVTVTDINNCTATNTVTITQPASGMTTSTAVTNVLCFGAATGAATVTVSGGSTPYSYSWSGAQTTSVISGQNAGVKTVTITDASACSTTATVTISQPASALSTVTAVTNVLCFGNATGSATLTASGGISPYSYSWSGAQTTSVISGQTSGIQTVTLTDANSCTIAATANITQPASALGSATAVTNVLCFGNATGSATLTASGGTSPYSYSWSGAQTTSVISGQTSGVKTVTITDANSCTTTNTVNITQPASGMTTSTAITNVLCFGAATGAATVTVSGGSTPYSYSWSGAQTTSVISGQNAGVKTVTITDASACSATTTVTISQPASALSTVTAVTNVLCFGNATGSATLTASGGTSPYSYSWSGAQTTSVISGQTSGIQTVTLTDANSCTIAATANITQPASALSSATAVTNVLCFGNATGSATLTASGGTAPYTYLWSSAQTTSVISGLNSGVRTVTLTDANNCTTTNTVNITQPASGLSISISASSSSLCLGNTVTLTANGSGGSGAVTYTWVAGPTSSINAVSPVANSTYTVNATDAGACAASQTIALTVLPAPNIGVSSGSICSGSTFVMVPSGATTYTFSSGSASVSPLTNTSYTVTGTDALGCTNTVGAVSSITVNASPTIAVSNYTICNGSSVVLVPTGASTFTYSGGSATVSPISNTTYSITGTSTAGCVGTNTALSAVTVNTLPIVSAAGGTICNGQSFTLAPTGASSYTYQGGSAVVSPTSTTSYTVSGTDAQGCVSATAAVASITVFALPTLSLSGGSICPGNSFTLVPSGAATYTYLNGGPVVTPAVTTSYSVTGTSSLGCPATNTVVAVLTVTNTLVVNITGSANICSGLSATLTANGASTYSWSNGATTASISVSPSVNTSYTAYGTSGTCSNNAAVTVTVNTTPTVSIAGTNTVCSGSAAVLTASGANSYSWSTAATTASISVNPTVNISYSVVGTSTDGCSASATKSLTVFAVPILTVNSGSICSGQSFVMNPSGAFTYSFSSGTATVSPLTTSSYSVSGTSTAGCVSNTSAISNVTVNITPTVFVSNGTICAGQSFTINPSGANVYAYSSGTNVVSPISNTSYSVTGTSAQGCASSNTAVVAVTVNTVPIISVNSGSICSGGSFVITPSGAASYSITGNSFTVSPATNTTYVITGIGANGCLNNTGSISQITVNANPTVGISNATICPGNSYVLTPTGASTYVYLNGGPSVTPAITTSYSVTGTSTAGCAATNTAVAVVTVSNSLSVGITGSANICSGNSATLTGTGATTYSWSTSATTASVSVSPLSNTTYTVYGVTGTCSNNAVVTVTVNTTPTISIAGTNTMCVGANVTYTASGANTYSWNTGALTSTLTQSPATNTNYTVTGTSGAGCSATASVITSVFVLPTITVNSGSVCVGQVFTITPSGANTYTYSGGSATVSPISSSNYSVTGTSTAGCLGSAVISSVTVNATPTISANSGSICAGGSFVIVPSGAASYVFSGGSATVNPAVTTTYSVTGTSSLGCAASNTALSTVSVIANPVLTITASSASVCLGNSSTLTVSGANSYTWQTGVNTNSINVTPVLATSYSVIGASAVGCINTASQTIGLFPNPTITISSSSASVCIGFSSTINAGGANTYTWSTGANTSAIVVSPTVTSSYTVNSTDLNGCITNTSVVIALNPQPTLTAVAINTGVCLGLSTNLVANGASTYTWNANANTSTIAVSPTIASTYSVTGSNGAGCLSSTTVSIAVYANPTVNIGANVQVGLGGNFSFNPTQSLAATYSWSPVDFLSSTTISNPLVTPLSDITYTLMVSSANGCTATSTVNVTVLTELIIANYMSPNGDGANDTWKVNVPVLIKDFSITIIDSYGRTVYSKDKEYNNEFDGRLNGDDLPDGTYYYFIKDGTKVKYKGSITLTK